MKKKVLAITAVALLAQGAIGVEAKAAKMPEGEKTNVKAPNQSAVSGRVTNEQGEALPGVVVRCGNMNVQTDINGEFHVNVNEGDKLTFSYIGYYTTTKDVDNKDINVVMKENSHALGEVIVTTQKKKQSSLEIPVAVSAVTGSIMEKLNLHQLDDVAQFTPGVQIQLQSPNNPGYVIRGVTSDDGEAYSQPRVSVFMDGVSTSRSRASAVELFDLERMEVAKGPQGTLFGRGAEIGGISIIRHKPVDNLSGELSMNYGSYNQRQVTGFINTPIIKGKLANRFAFDYDARDGFIKNEAGGRLNGKNALAFRNSTQWWANDDTSIGLILDYQHDDYPGTSFHSINPMYGSSDPNSTANLEAGKQLGIKRNVGGVLLNIDHNINQHWSFNSISGFRAFNSNERFDADGTYLPLLLCQEKEKGTQFSQEFRFNYDDKNRFSGFVGASYFYENSSQDVNAKANLQYLYPVFIQKSVKASLSSKIDGVKQLLSQNLPDAYKPMVDAALAQLMNKWFPENPAVDDNGKLVPQTTTPDIYGDLKTALGAVGMNLDQLLASMGDNGSIIQATLQGISAKPLDTAYTEQGKNYGINQAVELYADGTLKLTKNLNFTLGVRGTYENQETGYSSSTVPSMFGAVLYHPTEGGNKVTAKDSYWSWVGRAALNYMIGRNNIYASLSRGRRPGVLYFNNDPEDFETLKPEIIYSYEAGVKGSLLQGRLNYDFCAYYYDWYNYQTSVFNATTSKYEYDDAGRAHSFGIEASISYSPCRYLNLFGNWSYIEGKFNDKDDNGNAQRFAGNRFRLTPKNSFAAGFDLNIPTGKNGSIYFRPTYSWKSKVFFEESNEPDLTQGAFGLLNFTAGYRMKPGKVYYEIGAFGKNILDEKYVVDAGNSGRQIGFPTYVGGTRSVIGVMFKIGF
ncbi:TonB-dependent receptor [uncultured Prevotella sp.]|uniref:TonB-dependent receptor n=1 Tax=uncultured Prevotella sp. TaxID=159272 RepID=UPI0025D2074F|nr:TonB-dependent receptor [uncultured Prevotella sp.]